jgi:tetratricopeptide (TPR) repeat protein
MVANKGLKLVLIAVLLGGYAAAGQSDPWQKLNLSSTNIAGTTVHYEKCFEPNLPFFEKTYRQFLKATESKKTESLQNKDQIIAEINRILGIEDPNIKTQRRMLDDLTRPLPFPKPTFFLVTQVTVKDFLRAGGKLPNFTYDKATDTAGYYFQLWGTPQTLGQQTPQFAFPLKSEAEFEPVVSLLFGKLTEVVSVSPGSSTRVGLAIHEVAEASLVSRLKPQGPYCRWFTDGFANAITVEILTKQMSKKHAADFAEMVDSRKYEDLENQINLRYWMAGQYCVFLLGSPIDYEQRLIEARYAYAMHEAQRLIYKHGVDCVRKILDELSGAESRTGDDISDAIEKVTGEDMEARLNRYQTFRTREQGIPKYTVPFNAASKNNDYEQMLINLLRVMELHEFQFSADNLQSWMNAAWLLFKMGYEETGDEVMQNCISLFEHSPVPGGREAAMETFVLYALKCGHPKKAQETAEQMLTDRPDHALSLVVKMLVYEESGRLEEARQLARKVCSLAKTEKDKQSLSYKAASRVLAADPNQPASDKQPAPRAGV